MPFFLFNQPYKTPSLFTSPHLCVVLTALFCLLTDGGCCSGSVLLTPHSKSFQLTLMEEKLCKLLLLLCKLPVSIMKEIRVTLCVGKGMNKMK